MTDITFYITMTIVGLFMVLWGYAFLSTIVDDFHDNKNKILWILLLLFLPLSAVLFPFIATKQMPNGMEKMKKGIFTTILYIALFLFFSIIVTAIIVLMQ